MSGRTLWWRVGEVREAYAPAHGRQELLVAFGEQMEAATSFVALDFDGGGRHFVIARLDPRQSPNRSGRATHEAAPYALAARLRRAGGADRSPPCGLGRGRGCGRTYGPGARTPLAACSRGSGRAGPLAEGPHRVRHGGRRRPAARAALAGLDVAVPPLSTAEIDALRAALPKDVPAARRYRLAHGQAGLDLCRRADIPLQIMGRGPAEDPPFFAAAAATGALAAMSSLGREPDPIWEDGI